jgi:hypothetical protein
VEVPSLEILVPEAVRMVELVEEAAISSRVLAQQILHLAWVVWH